MRLPGRTLFCCLVLLTGGLSLKVLSHGEPVPLSRPLSRFPFNLGEYRGIEQGLEPAIVGALRLSDYLMRQYWSASGPPIGLYVGYYASQHTGTISHSPRHCLPGSGWTISRLETVTLGGQGTRLKPMSVNRVLATKDREQQVVLYWYHERGRVIAGEYLAKAYLMWDSVVQRRTNGALVRISVPVQRSEDDAFERAVDFTAKIMPVLSELLTPEGRLAEIPGLLSHRAETPIHN